MAIKPLKISNKPEMLRSVQGSSVDGFHSGQGSKFGLKLDKENASTQPPEKSILDYEDDELTPGHKACKKRFIQFDQKIRDEQAALNYESNTESSRSSQQSEKPLDFDKDFDENFFKRSVEL